MTAPHQPGPPSSQPQLQTAKPPSKTKQEALQACAEQHHNLVTCFKTCSFGSTFTGCCTEEHREFWACYTRERGTNETRIKSWLDGVFSSGSSTRAPQQQDQQAAVPQPQQPQQQQQRKQQ